eukprot:TRINITY_DN2959_c0_g1_i1.p1 TRINITY_DN2959_c0_g1~~TRINITY_DN2959_c0_g1_i1.p1  ORF type:complete len:626 (+),score=93.21 TRINITY_DN2959_c0_g1_i1:61-1938(+)
MCIRDSYPILNKGRAIRLSLWILGVLLLNWLVKWLFSYSFFFLTSLGCLGFIAYRIKSIIKLNDKYTLLKASTVIDAPPKQILDSLLDYENKRMYDIFSYEVQLLESVEGKNRANFKEIIKVPENVIFSSMYKPREVYYTQYWQQDDNGGYSYYRKTIPESEARLADSSNILLKGLEEAFIIMPIQKSSQCIVFFISRIDYGGLIHAIMRDKLKLKRIGILIGLKAYVQEQSIRKQNESIFSSPKAENSNKIDTNISPFANSATNDPEEKKNDVSIYTNKKKLPLEKRYPRYHKYRKGGIWCNNKDDLKSQNGIILDLLKSAGNELLHGRGIIGLSLPVRVFEPRSMLERITDLWGTGQKYLTQAAHSAEPIERMKNIITFVISGLYTNAPQRKPFNPIIGETYQGHWPDGTSISMEHTSHHPPISHFYISNPKYQYWGYYEYLAKLADFGNSGIGRMKGVNKIAFLDNSEITFELPAAKISGILFGKRVLQWIGNFKVAYPQYNLEAVITFTPPPGFFSSQVKPSDCFEGEIAVNGQSISKITGSWLENIKFDTHIYWEFETADLIRPKPIADPLPSDCRFREDLQAWKQKDLSWAQKEKDRLQVLQRADRKTREDFAKASKLK